MAANWQAFLSSFLFSNKFTMREGGESWGKGGGGVVAIARFTKFENKSVSRVLGIP